MHFGAPWGRLLKVISVSVTAILLCIVGMGIAATSWGLPPVSRVLMVLAPLLSLILTAPFAIRGYTLDGNELVVHRLLWDSRFSLSGLKEARIVPSAMRSSIRLLGNGGLFSFTGLFWNRELGRYRALVTDLKRTVVLTLPDRTLVISPEDPGRFVGAVRAKTDYVGARL